jgi:magnesium transporter
MINALIREEHPLIDDQTKTYLRDCYDHTIQLVDVLETYREIASGLIDVYLSSLSHRMNEIMKVLTFIATIFIPLGFIAGLYGMNFSPEKSPWNMPELNWYYGYPYALALMAAVVLGMVLYFRSRGWIGKGPAKRPASPDDGA